MPVTPAPETVDEGPNAPGSLGRLIPWPDDETYPNIPAEEALDLFLGWADARGIELWPHQEEALLSLAAGDHLIWGRPRARASRWWRWACAS